MIDLRYHIATVIALFLALGIGIFIGSTVISDDLFIKEQEQLIALLEHDFDNLRSENRLLKSTLAELQDSIKEYNKIVQEIFPVLADGKLLNKKIGLIVTNPDYDLEQFIQLFSTTKAQFVYTISINEKIFTRKAKDKDLILSEIVNGITYILEHDSNDIKIENLIKISGDIQEQADLIIVFGGSNNDDYDYAKILDYPLINYLLEKNFNVVGVEAGNVLFSYASIYEKLGIPLINNIDTVLGKLKLLELLEE